MNSCMYGKCGLFEHLLFFLDGRLQVEVPCTCWTLCEHTDVKSLSEHMHTHMRSHTHTRMHACTHTHTHTHTHTQHTHTEARTHIYMNNMKRHALKHIFTCLHAHTSTLLGTKLSMHTNTFTANMLSHADFRKRKETEFFGVAAQIKLLLDMPEKVRLQLVKTQFCRCLSPFAFITAQLVLCP